MLKQKRKSSIKLFFFIGMFAAVFLLAQNSSKVRAASAENAPTLKVVITNCDDDGYIQVNDKELTGYYIDYLEEIAKYTGWKRIILGCIIIPPR